MTFYFDITVEPDDQIRKNRKREKGKFREVLKIDYLC